MLASRSKQKPSIRESSAPPRSLGTKEGKLRQTNPYISSRSWGERVWGFEASLHGEKLVDSAVDFVRLVPGDPVGWLLHRHGGRAFLSVDLLHPPIGVERLVDKKKEKNARYNQDNDSKHGGDDWNIVCQVSMLYLVVIALQYNLSRRERLSGKCLREKTELRSIIVIIARLLPESRIFEPALQTDSKKGDRTVHIFFVNISVGYNSSMIKTNIYV